MISCSLIGLGQWGIKLFYTIKEFEEINIKYICKKNINKKKFLDTNAEFVYSFKKAINQQIDVVFISSPSETHFEIAKYALEREKDVFVEKPICLKHSEYEILENLAKKNSLILHVNYIHLYNENFLSFIEIYKKNRIFF